MREGGRERGREGGRGRGREGGRVREGEREGGREGGRERERGTALLPHLSCSKTETYWIIQWHIGKATATVHTH